jgi:hypothetical protein
LQFLPYNAIIYHATSCSLSNAITKH